MKRLSEAETEIMQILWDAKTPVTSGYIQEKLRKYRIWKLPAVMSALAKLNDKGFVYCDRTTRTNYYSSLIEETSYKKFESRNFLNRMFDNSLTNMIATLFDNEKLTAKEAEELEKIIKKYEE